MNTSLANYLPGANLPALSEKELGAALIASADAIRTGGGGGLYLKFSGKSGLYTLSDTGLPPAKDDTFIVEPQSFIKGWTCWMNQKDKARHKWSIHDKATDAVHKDDLENFGPYKASEGWKAMAGFGCFSMTDENKMYSFENTSTSGRNSVAALMKEIGARAEKNEPSMPVITFTAEEFTSGDNTNIKPLFPVESWVTREAFGAYLDPDVKYDLDDLMDGKKAPKDKKKGK